MQQVLDKLYSWTAIRRAIGIAILASLLALVGYLKREHLYDTGSYRTDDERAYSGWFELGLWVAALALLFVAVGFIIGRPRTETADGNEAAHREGQTRSSDRSHWD